MLGQMRDLIFKRFSFSNRLYNDLASALGPEQLGSKLPNIRSNTMGAQLWCVVGGRHSTAVGVRAGGWKGFESVMTSAETVDPESVTRILSETYEEVAALAEDFDEFDETQGTLLLGLLEHETFHQGQLVRYLYGLDIDRPLSWKKRYSLT